ncbi:MAG TPA: metalloregulator ArsR/SmtB family transcription factor [Pyrinomonadaceae bacterium]|nr:metalloregulator ArsR/SmtB family transcription factor [Pyrinomonadaceae bacterium]
MPTTNVTNKIFSVGGPMKALNGRVGAKVEADVLLELLLRPGACRKSRGDPSRSVLQFQQVDKRFENLFWSPASTTSTPEKNVKKDLRNRTVAHKLATDRFHERATNMRRDIFQAIADPTRRAIIALIALQAMTPNAIEKHFNTTRQAVSKHLRILTECELVRQEQKGREIYYSLETEQLKAVTDWLEKVQEIWEGNYKRLDALLAELKQAQKEERKK